MNNIDASPEKVFVNLFDDEKIYIAFKDMEKLKKEKDNIKMLRENLELFKKDSQDARYKKLEKELEEKVKKYGDYNIRMFTSVTNDSIEFLYENENNGKIERGIEINLDCFLNYWKDMMDADEEINKEKLDWLSFM